MAVTRNTVTLTGEITAIDALRHTPAGLPLIRLKLAHQSVQVEAGVNRQTAFEVSAMAIGGIASSAARFKTGDAVTIDGFLAGERRSGAPVHTRSGHPLILHITNIQRI
ncbi:MAG: primosomal replication protein N [Betaproteobacteria bacterium]|nr:primosomal replication protein N [Betaproteobacteria bacterium]